MCNFFQILTWDWLYYLEYYIIILSLYTLYNPTFLGQHILHQIYPGPSLTHTSHTPSWTYTSPTPKTLYAPTPSTLYQYTSYTPYIPLSLPTPYSAMHFTHISHTQHILYATNSTPQTEHILHPTHLPNHWQNSCADHCNFFVGRTILTNSIQQNKHYIYRKYWFNFPWTTHQFFVSLD